MGSAAASYAEGSRFNSGPRNGQLSFDELERIWRQVDLHHRFRMPTKTEELLLDNDYEAHVKRARTGNGQAYLGAKSKSKVLGW